MNESIVATLTNKPISEMKKIKISNVPTDNIIIHKL